jgi:hypothetical protein
MANPNARRRTADHLRLAPPMADAGWQPRAFVPGMPDARSGRHIRLVKPARSARRRRRRSTPQVTRDFAVALAIASMWLALMEAVQALLG